MFFQKQRGENKRKQPDNANRDSWYWIHVDIEDFEKKETKADKLKWVITKKPPYQIVDEDGVLNRYDGWYHPEARGPAKANFFFGFQPTQVQRDLLSGVLSNRDLYLHLGEIINDHKNPQRPWGHMDHPICKIIAEYAPVDDQFERLIVVVRCNKQEAMSLSNLDNLTAPIYVVKTVDTAIVVDSHGAGEDLKGHFLGRGAIFTLSGTLGKDLICADPSRPPGYNSNKRHKKSKTATTMQNSLHCITDEFVWKQQTASSPAGVFALLMTMGL